MQVLVTALHASTEASEAPLLQHHQLCTPQGTHRYMYRSKTKSKGQRWVMPHGVHVDTGFKATIIHDVELARPGHNHLASSMTVQWPC